MAQLVRFIRQKATVLMLLIQAVTFVYVLTQYPTSESSQREIEAVYRDISVLQNSLRETTLNLTIRIENMEQALHGDLEPQVKDVQQRTRRVVPMPAWQQNRDALILKRLGALEMWRLQHGTATR